MNTQQIDYHNVVHRLVTVAILALTLGALSSKAQGANVGTDRMRLGTEADFGSGTHVFGTPDFGTIRWDFTPDGSRVRVTARVLGRLYLDKIGPGCVRLMINFLDADTVNIFSRTIQFCGPGNNANSSDNQRTIDVSSGALFRLRQVQLVVGEGPTLGEIVDEGLIPRGGLPCKGTIRLITAKLILATLLTPSGRPPVMPTYRWCLTLRVASSGVLQGGSFGTRLARAARGWSSISGTPAVIT